MTLQKAAHADQSEAHRRAATETRRHRTAMERYTVCLYFQDLETGKFKTVYPQGMSADEVMMLLADPAKQFTPLPPPPPVPAFP